MQYLNTHHVLQNLRQQAKESKRAGPRVVVAGPTDTGKSSLCKMLLNWAVRSDHQPTYVDLDIGKPGSLLNWYIIQQLLVLTHPGCEVLCEHSCSGQENSYTAAPSCVVGLMLVLAPCSALSGRLTARLALTGNLANPQNSCC